jgi:putative transposase
MKKSRFSEEKIISILREADAGVKITELCRKHGMSDATFYKWKVRYGGLYVFETLNEVRRMTAERLVTTSAGPMSPSEIYHHDNF